MATPESPQIRRMQPIQLAAAAVAVAFLLAGVLGFIPGVTTGTDGMTFAGAESTAMLLGVFHVSVLHNLVHLLFGVVGLVLARTTGGSAAFLVGGGLIYLVLWVYGLVIDAGSDANFVPLNDADGWLHLVLGAAMVVLGLVLRRRTLITGPAGTPELR